MNQIAGAGRTDFQVKKSKKKIFKLPVADDFDIPDISFQDLTNHKNTARPEDITLRERNEEFLQFDEEMLDFTVRLIN